MKRKNNIIHLADIKKECLTNAYAIGMQTTVYYKCIHAVGMANPLKVTTNKKKVTCKNCIKWYIN